jgi:hypothetical protein
VPVGHKGHEIVNFKLQHWPKNVVQQLYEAGREKVACENHSGFVSMGSINSVNRIARSNAESWCSNFQASEV